MSERKCQRCPFKGPTEAFPRKKRGAGYILNCANCQANIDRKKLLGKGSNKDNSYTGADTFIQPDANLDRPTELDLDELIQLLEENNTYAMELDALVMMVGEEDNDDNGGGDVEGPTDLQRAHSLGRIIHAATGYRWK